MEGRLQAAGRPFQTAPQGPLFRSLSAKKRRPLNKRGRESAKTMAAYLRRARISPDVVVCSTALRAKQTLEPIANAIKPPRVTFESRIYGVAQPELLKYLRGLPESVECALLIGHNPGLHDLALALADAKSRKHLPPAEGKFPTGAMATFRFDGAWKELRSNGATVLSFTSPKK